MRVKPQRVHPHRAGFTLIELLVVISIISLLISILLPSLSRAREQAKSVHCLARLKDMGTALEIYTNSFDSPPPARWYPEYIDGEQHEGVQYGWQELVWMQLYRETLKDTTDFPVQRNVGGGDRFEEYFTCKAVGDLEENSGHYRAYLPAWSFGSYDLDKDRRWTDQTHPNPDRAANRERIRLRLPIIGDANELSERGDGFGTDDCSYIDGGEADYAGSNGRSNGNRFSDRHYGGTNYLFPDLHGKRSTSLRKKLARDYDLNGVDDVDVDP